MRNNSRSAQVFEQRPQLPPSGAPETTESRCTLLVPNIHLVPPKRRWGLLGGLDTNSSLGQERTCWSVKRCAARDEASRIALGGRTSPQNKIECSSLTVVKGGVIGEACGSRQEVRDYNDYRTKGHRGRFEPCTPDRAVSLMAITVYEELQQKLPRAQILHGDLGENFLIEGPTHTGAELCVGMALQIGDEVVVELTEANKPCYRLGYVKWAPEAQRVFGDTWWNNKELPLMGNQLTGGRGWLAKVIVEGTVAPGATVRVLSR